MMKERPFWWPEIQPFLAILLVVGLLVIAMKLVWTQPDADMTKIVMGALLTVGFASVIAFYFGSNRENEKRGDTITRIAMEPGASTPPSSDDIAKATMSPEELAYYQKLPDDVSKKAFFSKGAAERAADMAKGG